jgi:hypothetical protein
VSWLRFKKREERGEREFIKRVGLRRRWLYRLKEGKADDIER